MPTVNSFDDHRCIFASYNCIFLIVSHLLMYFFMFMKKPMGRVSVGQVSYISARELEKANIIFFTSLIVLGLRSVNKNKAFFSQFRLIVHTALTTIFLQTNQHSAGDVVNITSTVMTSQELISWYPF